MCLLKDLELNLGNTGVLESWSNGKSISRHILEVKMICAHLPEFFFPNYIYPTADHNAVLSNSLFIQLVLIFTQHSNTPVLQHCFVDKAIVFEIIPEDQVHSVKTKLDFSNRRLQ